MDKQIKEHYPYSLQNTSTISPDQPEFHNFPLNLVVVTKYGRFIFLRHGNEDKCSSFIATLVTIVNKLELSFGSEQHPAKFKHFTQGKLSFHMLRRNNFMYIFWNKQPYGELRLYSMVDFFHYQLMSILTTKVDHILDENQTYDPTINFGKGKLVHNLLQFSVENGLHTLPILVSALPVVPLTNTTRNQLHSILNVKQYKEDGLQISILLSMNGIISVSKKKGIEAENKDIFLFYNLLHSQSSLSKSENWFPICLPGIEAESLIFCYINYIGREVVHIMVADQSEIFPRLSAINKEIKQKLETTELLQKIKAAEERNIVNIMGLDKNVDLKHFLVLNHQTQQMLMSSGQYFGDNISLNPEFNSFINIYSTLYQKLLTSKHNRKQKLYVECAQHYTSAYYDEGNYLVMIIGTSVCDMEEVKTITSCILKVLKEDESMFFVSKF